MKQIINNKKISYSLGAFVALQLLSLVIHSPIIFLAYEIVFLFAVLQGAIELWIKAKNNELTRYLLPLLGLFFLSNLLLFIVYLPVIYFNPNINWSLKDGGNESDPMILIMFWPPAHFIFSLIVLGIVGIFGKLFNRTEKLT